MNIFDPGTLDVLGPNSILFTARCCCFCANCDAKYSAFALGLNLFSVNGVILIPYCWRMFCVELLDENQ